MGKCACSCGQMWAEHMRPQVSRPGNIRTLDVREWYAGCICNDTTVFGAIISALIYLPPSIIMTSLAVTKQSKTHSSVPHVWVLDTEAVLTEAYLSIWDQIGLERCFQSISFNNADKFKFLLIVLLQPVSGTVSCWRSKTTASTLRVCTSGWLGSADSQLGSLDSRAGCYFAASVTVTSEITVMQTNVSRWDRANSTISR